MSLNDYWSNPFEVDSDFHDILIRNNFYTSHPVPYTPTWSTTSCGCDSAYLEWMKKERQEITSKPTVQIPKVDHVIFNDAATIVFWTDGSKTVVKCSNHEIYDIDKAILTAFTIRVLGGKGEYRRMMKKAFENLPDANAYRWTDICKQKFYSETKTCQIKKLNEFMAAIDKNFDLYGYLSIQRLGEITADLDILDNAHQSFAMPKRSGNEESRLVWTNRSDFGISQDFDPKTKKHYYHIYIRRSPEPKSYPADWKGEENAE